MCHCVCLYMALGVGGNNYTQIVNKYKNYLHVVTVHVGHFKHEDNRDIDKVFFPYKCIPYFRAYYKKYNVM